MPFDFDYDCGYYRLITQEGKCHLQTYFITD